VNEVRTQEFGKTRAQEMFQLRQLNRAHLRYGNLIPNLKDVEHYRIDNPYRDSKRPGFIHIGVVVLSNGACYCTKVSQNKTNYVRKIWFTKAVGISLKNAAIDCLYEDEPRHATFFVDEEYEKRDLHEAVADELRKRGIM